MLDRRTFLIAGACAALARPAAGQTTAISRTTAYSFSFKAIDGGTIRLVEFSGRPILIVNVASQCGYTPQYAGLRALKARFGDQLAIVGVPSNDFNQEPGSAAEILATAHGQYQIDFPLAEKVVVRGTEAHPFYRWAAFERPLDVPRWNFHKHLIGRDGRLVASFTTQVEPMDARVIEAIVRELRSE
jgi:glutathione peroxidase